MEGMEGGWARVPGRRPLALQRVLSEGGTARPRARAQPALRGEDKENCGQQGEEGGECDPLSSTVMDRSTPDRRQPAAGGLFSTSDNLSSISLVRPEGAADRLFKTPKRQECSGSGRSGSSGRGSSGTPGSASSTRWNPFDSHRSYDLLHQPTLSPGVFATVVSPGQETEAADGRFWSIEQQADMFPTNISEESPLKQSLLVRHHSKDLENRTQEQIELYFAEHHAVTSPPDLAPTGPLLPGSRDSSYLLARSGTAASTQTLLTLPPCLPPALEALLAQHCTFREPSQLEEPGVAALSNSTLRRKLFNGDAHSGSECEWEEEGSSRSSSPCAGSPLGPGVTPGREIRTPRGAWSSSPVGRPCRRGADFSPPEEMSSPIFSPIAQGCGARRPLDQEVMEARPASPLDITSDETAASSSLLYHTADSADSSRAANEMDTDSNSLAAWAGSGREGYGWAASTARDGWALDTREEAGSGTAGWTASLLPDETAEGGSRDTGYTSGPPDSLASTAVSPAQQQDSAVSCSVRPEGVSGIGLPSAPAPAPGQVLVSYAAEGCNDISVGFPLGSSTPTKT